MHCVSFSLLSSPCQILLFIGPRKKLCFSSYLSCYVSLNQALFRCSSPNLKFSRLKWHLFETSRSQITESVSVKRSLRTTDCGPGVKCRLRVKCRLQTESKMQAFQLTSKFILGSEAQGNKREEMYNSLLSLKTISFLLFYSPKPSMNLDTSTLVLRIVKHIPPSWSPKLLS